jgi:hypothetical protein
MSYTQADLNMAELRIAEGEEHIVRQERVLTRLRAAGARTEIAEDLMAEFRESLQQHREHRDRIAKELRMSGTS